ncbi:MAG: hypothetical protein CXZ00_05245 [Acidobacteria bacterium]|nr:MAG: hypothetical protein CXZ00_05245 [Acidobacteriota bacterium]
MITPDSSAELVHQLTRIADAAAAYRGSAWADWVKTISSFALGLFASYLTGQLSNRSSDQNEQNKMRRIVYQELAQWFFELHSLVCEETKLRRVRYSIIQNFGTFAGEEYMKQNPAVYYGLDEGPVLSSLYSCFHRVEGGGIGTPRVYGLVEVKHPLRYFSDSYRQSRIVRKNFKRVLSAQAFASLDSLVNLSDYKRAATIEEMVDSGILEIVDKPRETADEAPTAKD